MIAGETGGTGGTGLSGLTGLTGLTGIGNVSKFPIPRAHGLWFPLKGLQLSTVTRARHQNTMFHQEPQCSSLALEDNVCMHTLLAANPHLQARPEALAARDPAASPASQALLGSQVSADEPNSCRLLRRHQCVDWTQ